MQATTQGVNPSATRIGYEKGALAGLVGGLIMAVVAMMVTAAMGMGIFETPAMIAGLVLGPGAAGITAVLVGFVVHMMFSAIFGVLFAAIVNGVTHEFVGTGLALGIALWLVNFYAIASVLPSARMVAQSEPFWLALMTHALFGISTGLLAKKWAS